MMSASKKLWIGYQESEPETPFQLQLDDLYTHMAIIGSSGSGKTVLAKALIEAAISNDVPCVVIDPQGDLVKLAQVVTSDQVPEVEGNLYQGLRESFLDKVFPVIFTPGTKYGLKCIFNPLTSFPDPMRVNVHKGMIFDSFVDETNPDAAVISEEELSLLLGGIADGILSFVPNSYLKGRNRPLSRVVLFKSLNQAFESGIQLNSINDLIEWMNQLDSAGFFTESEEKNLSNLIEALKIVTEGPEAVLFTDGIPIDPDIFLRAPEGKVPLVIFYLNVLPSLQSKQAFVANLTLLLYSFCLQNGSGDFLYFIDEVRDFIPSGTKQPPSKSILKTFFTQSRKYRVISVIATQSVGSIDYEVLGQCNTRAYGRLTVEQELKKLREFLPPDKLDQLPLKTPGHFLIHSRRGGYHDIRVRRLITEHGTPVPPSSLPSVLVEYKDVIEHYKNFWVTQEKASPVLDEEHPFDDDSQPADIGSNVSDQFTAGVVVDDDQSEAAFEEGDDFMPEYDVESVLPLLQEELIGLFKSLVDDVTSFQIGWKILDDKTLNDILDVYEIDQLKQNMLGGMIYRVIFDDSLILFSTIPVKDGHLVVTAFQ